MSPFFAPLLEPLGALSLLMALGVLWLLARAHWRAAAWLAAPTLILWVLGSTPIAETLVRRAEQPYATNVLATLPVADAVIALGGGHTPSAYDPLRTSINEAGDRVLAALEIVRRGKAKMLVLGGSGPQSGFPERPNMAFVQEWITNWHLCPVTLTNLGLCGNTRDEALRCRELQVQHGWKRVILVTSALHLPRSTAVFRGAGVEVIPVAADFQVAGVPELPDRFSPFPSQRRFDLLAQYLHERIGELYYRARGWTRPAT
jgi:uncharacterized SAM-binding protein YcdF (DUF218 family)